MILAGPTHPCGGHSHLHLVTMSLTGHLSSSVSCTACSRRLGPAADGSCRSSCCNPPRCTASKRHRGASEEGASGSRQLPREQGWLLDEANSRHRVKAVGPGFVMTRPGSQGLVVSPGSQPPTHPPPRPPAPPFAFSALGTLLRRHFLAAVAGNAAISYKFLRASLARPRFQPLHVHGLVLLMNCWA